jgi:hypothetical protein
MSIYVCDECGQTKDDDYSPCGEIIGRPTAFICAECMDEKETLADQLHDELIDNGTSGGLDIE